MKTARGKEISMEGLRAQHEHAIAVGNVKMNARGDILGKGGQIIKTREQAALEYNTQVQDPVKNIPVSSENFEPVKAKSTESIEQVDSKKTKIDKPKASE